jgi:NRAMP (natural resistance-associated macrophage protein)-like metal ion transporter
LGPGLVTGAANDDPSGIATYSSIGAQYGYSMLWTMIFIYPFMAGIQEISGRLGRITGRGIAGNIHRFYPRWASYLVVALLLLANIINIGADIGAMGAAVNLLTGGPALVYSVIFAFISVLLQIFVPYKTYSTVLKWLALSLFAYVGTAPVMYFMMLMASDPKIIGKLHLPVYLKAVGWAATGIMALAAITMFITSGK